MAKPTNDIDSEKLSNEKINKQFVETHKSVGNLFSGISQDVHNLASSNSNNIF